MSPEGNYIRGRQKKHYAGGGWVKGTANEEKDLSSKKRKKIFI